MKITVLKNDGRRGDVTRSIEFQENVSVQDAIGAIDGFLRAAFPDEMRRKCLNLSNRTDGQADSTEQRTEELPSAAQRAYNLVRGTRTRPAEPESEIPQPGWRTRIRQRVQEENADEARVTGHWASGAFHGAETQPSQSGEYGGVRVDLSPSAAAPLNNDF